MQFRFVLLLLSTLVFAHNCVLSQTIKGEVMDKTTHHAVQGVSIVNTYTSLSVTTNEDGSFVIAASGDQLLEFRKAGYKSVKVRVPLGYMPSYFKIIMEHGMPTLAPAQQIENRYVYAHDSLTYRELYKHELDFQRLTGLSAVAHPFSALSKRNREIWRFQEDYTEFEKEKYIDRTFNGETVTKFTGLSGDSLQLYLVKFRPDYEQLRRMNDYTFFNFIKTTVTLYRKGPDHPRGAQ